MTIKKRIALAYKVHRVSALIDEDIKLIKKLNITLQKLEKTNKDQYILESINILRVLTNVFDAGSLYFKYHATVAFLLEHLQGTETVTLIKKLQNLSESCD
jgi:hypothetical protein